MRLYCPDLPGTGALVPGEISVQGEEFEYAKILRARPGDTVFLFDGKGREARGVIADIARKRLLVRTEEVFSNFQKEPALDVALLPGILKGQKMDFVIQKAVELGVCRISPLITGRTQIGETRKLDRWRKISIEAARQCGRSVVPPVDEPVVFSRYFFLEKNSVGERRGVIFWEGGGAGLKELSGRLRDARRLEVAVGPEGGFSAEEVSLAKEKGFHVAGLGPRILRAETAAVLAVGLVQFLFGDLG